MSAEPPQVSPDGKFYWDGERWVATLSDDQRWKWDGTKWVAVEQASPTQLAQQPASTSVYVYGPRTNSLAVGALIAGIAAWVVCPLIAATVAVVLGHISRNQIRRTGEGGTGMSIAGLILGYIQLVAVGLVFLVVFVSTFFSLIGATTHH